jgi:hypothetical protein
MRRTAILLTLCALLVFPAFAGAAFELGAKGAYWMPEFSGDFRLDRGRIRGTTIDVKDDAGLDDENFFFGEAWLRAGRHRLSLSAMRVDYSGQKTLSQDIVFGGRTFSVEGRAKSSLEYTSFDLAYQYDLIRLEGVLAGFSLGPILQLTYLDGEVKMSGDGTINGVTGLLEASRSFQIPLPLIGAGARLGLLAGWLEARARAVGIAYRNDALWEIQAEAALTPTPFLEFIGGYRRFVIDVESDGVLLHYTQSGPYLGAALVF